MSIGKEAFNNCSKLTLINIPNRVTSIGDKAFSECESLILINIPEEVTEIGEKAFYYCNNLTSIYIAKPNDDYRFVKWNDDNTDNPREITVDQNLKLTAIFEKDNPTAIEAIKADNTNKTIKTIKDGQIVIIRDGIMYDMHGRKL